MRSSERSCFRVVLPSLLLAVALAAAGHAAGGKIAFSLDAGTEGRASRVFLAEADGSNPRPVTPGTGRDRAPAFSPDGTLLAYQTTNDLGLDSLMVVPVDGSRPPRHLAVGASPQWSSDSKRLLFARRQANEWFLHTIAADGSQSDAGLKPLTKGQIGRWSRDEKQLAAVVPVIVDGRDRWQLQVMPADRPVARLRITLPESYGQVVSLDWSPDNENLLFSATRGGQYDLFVVSLRSPEPHRVLPANDPPNPAYGAWSPDGKEILFRSTVGVESDAPVSRLHVVKADGTGLRTLWEPREGAVRLHGTAWAGKVTQQVAANPPQVPPKPDDKPLDKPVDKPAVPMPAPPVKPMPAPPAPERKPGPPRKLHSAKTFVLTPERSPVSVRLAAPGAADFLVSLPVAPSKKWSPRRQGVGVSLELEDGSLYRGTLIHSGVPWVTFQGRPRGGKVRLIDGKKLDPASQGFAAGFKLTVRREGKNLILAVNDADVLTRPLLTSGVKSLSLTLENFDPGVARFPLGSIYYRVWQ